MHPDPVHLLKSRKDPGLEARPEILEVEDRSSCMMTEIRVELRDGLEADLQNLGPESPDHRAVRGQGNKRKNYGGELK